jgi:hypothetical protein
LDAGIRSTLRLPARLQVVVTARSKRSGRIINP